MAASVQSAGRGKTRAMIGISAKVNACIRSEESIDMKVNNTFFLYS